MAHLLPKSPYAMAYRLETRCIARSSYRAQAGLEVRLRRCVDSLCQGDELRARALDEKATTNFQGGRLITFSLSQLSGWSVPQS